MRIVPPVIFGALIIFVGIYVAGKLALYQDFPYFDSVMHFLGGVAIGWFVLAHRSMTSFKALMAITLVIGVLWEIAEFTSGSVFGPGDLIYKYFRGGDRLDTLYDVLLDLGGAALLFLLWPRRSDTLQRLDA